VLYVGDCLREFLQINRRENEGLGRLFNLAVKQKARLLVLDADAPEVNSLPKYDW
jgi:hypothetical protein